MWPIVDPSTIDRPTKKRAMTEDASVEDLGSLTGEDRRSTSVTGTSTSISKKRQNPMPLFNAMRTTALHSTSSFKQHSAEPLSTEPSQETIVTSATPGAAREETPAAKATDSRTPAPKDGAVRPSAPPVKKKKKRKSQHLSLGSKRVCTMHDLNTTCYFLKACRAL